MNTKISVRMSGLGGQGVVTAAHILGTAATKEAWNSIVNPFFGAEKRLAPAESYVRIAKNKIHERGEVLTPDIIMIFHPHVITMGKCYTMPFYEGLQKHGIIIINSDEILPLREDDLSRLAELEAKVFYIPATQLAVEIGGTDLSTNMAMLGALLGVTNLVSINSLKEALIERFDGGKFVASGTTAVLDDALKGKYDKVAKLIEKNLEVVEKAICGVREQKLGG